MSFRFKEAKNPTTRYFGSLLDETAKNIKKAARRGESLAKETKTGKSTIANLIHRRKVLRALLEEPGSDKVRIVRRADPQ